MTKTLVGGDNELNRKTLSDPLECESCALAVGPEGSLPGPGSPASLKHELRTPLNHIIGYCEMLIEEATDRNLGNLLLDLEHIHTAGRRLLAVINDLFDPDKPPVLRENPGLLHREVRTPLNQIIGYAEMLEEEARGAGLGEFVSDLAKIHASARHLLQHISEHFGAARTEFLAAAGVTPASATTFLRRVSSAPPWQIGSGESSGAPGQAGLILAVDDDPANREMLERRLKRLGHLVRLAENGRHALELLREVSFDLVLLDLQMPEMTGSETLALMKGDPALRHIPVIVLSASDETARVARCVEMGAEDYLPKPFDPVLLQARIGASLEKCRLREREVSHLRRIQEEQRRSDELLHVILPRDVAEELKSTKLVRPRRFDDVAVLFCDIVSFTAYCNDHSPEEVLLSLQGVVQAFEKLTVQHSLEKIKTIGDAFMATAGMLAPLDHPLLQAVRCGLAMITVARELPPHWQVRVGVHAGSVIAGVVGRQKYQYDVWGDTVNTAMRMVEAAAPGSVCVNADSWKLVQAQCRGRPQGCFPVKGKGMMELIQIEAVHLDEHI